MKKPHLITLVFLVSIVAIFSFLTLRVFSSNSQNIELDPQTQSIILKLPDQEYTLTTHDLESQASTLVIPTLDLASPKIAYDQNSGALKAVSSPKDYLIDLVALRQGDLSYTMQDRYSKTLADFNDLLAQVHRTALSVSIKDGRSLVEINLDPSLLRSIIRPVTTDLVHPLDLDKNALTTHLASTLTPKQKKYFNSDVAYQNTKNALNSRFMTNQTPVVLGVDDGPSSRGELASKYLEVDLSQQKMYFFIDHKLFKEYKISTGAEYPTPVGEFHILNKAPNAFSSIYNVWMPYWMAFSYARDVGAYLGLHEIAYAIDAKGKHLYRYGNYIGEMMTGGCVAMAPHDSREIYNLSDVGMLIRIVK